MQITLLLGKKAQDIRHSKILVCGTEQVFILCCCLGNLFYLLCILPASVCNILNFSKDVFLLCLLRFRRVICPSCLPALYSLSGTVQRPQSASVPAASSVVWLWLVSFGCFLRHSFMYIRVVSNLLYRRL